MQRFRFTLLVLLIIAAFTLQAMPYQEGVPAWGDFLAAMSRANFLSVAVGIALSIIADYIPGYDALQPKAKRLVFLGVSLFLPLLAASLGVLTAGFDPSWEATFWPAVAAGAMTGWAGTTFHTRKLESA